MTRQPVIGLTAYCEDARWSHWHKPAVLLPANYAEMVAAAGGIPVLLPPVPGIATAVSRLDGVLLTGGGDIDPGRYGAQPHPATSRVSQERDAAEVEVLNAAVAASTPVLGVCRGMQLLNVALGGTLHQHLPDVIGTLAHRSAPFVFGDVTVETVPGTRAAAVFGPSPTVLCSHHQSIAALGRGLVTTASAADGVIEAIELPTARFVLGVQWHPEEGMDQRPFDALVEAATAHAREQSVLRSA
jgi:gamma-glutamyl-gamma-aminobutyrate hydrolase PuuD